MKIMEILIVSLLLSAKSMIVLFSEEQFRPACPDSGLDIRIESGPVYADCTCAGFCSIELDLGWRITDKLVVGQGHGTAIIENNQLIVSILKRSLDARTTSCLFSSEAFVVGADVKISGLLASELGVKSYTIKAGRYRISRSKEAYIMVF